MGICNYCSLKRIERSATKDNKKVLVLGKTAYKVPVDMDEDNFKNLTEAEKEKYFSAWFMGLTNYCCC